MNGIVFFALIIAVVVWLAISLILVLGREARRAEAGRKEAAAAVTVETAAPAFSEAVHAPEPGMTSVREPLMLDGAPVSWEMQLAELSGLTGWVMLETNGDIIESSDEQFESAGASLGKLLGWIYENSGSLGYDPLQLLELDTEKGSIIVLFPRQAEETARLVLFLDTEMYKNQIRETLSHLNWEANLKGVEAE